MSALGNYVHLHKENYDVHGITRDGNGEKWGSVYSRVKSRVGQETSYQAMMAEAKQLEEQYNELFYPKANTFQTNRFRAAFEKAVNQKLEKEFGLIAGTFNPSNLSIETNALYENMIAAIKDAKTSYKTIEGIQSLKAEDLLTKAKEIEELLNQDAFKSVPEAKGELETAQARVQEIIKKLANESGARELPANSVDVQTLKEIISLWNRTPLLTNESGDVFEWLLPYIELQGSTLAEEELVKAMQKLTETNVQGTNRTQLSIPDITKSAYTATRPIDINNEKNFKMKVTTVRDKTDVVITYQDQLDNSIKTKNVSAKNITTLSDSIHLVQNSNLYRMLALSNDYDFGTHYLNVITSTDNKTSDSSRLKQANQLMNALMIRLGMEGFDVNNKAELLIINNAIEKKISVYNIKALIYYIQKAIVGDENGISSKNIYVSKLLSADFTIEQEYDDNGPNARILTLLRNLQSIKIDLKMQTGALMRYAAGLKSFSP